MDINNKKKLLGDRSASSRIHAIKESTNSAYRNTYATGYRVKNTNDSNVVAQATARARSHGASVPRMITGANLLIPRTRDIIQSFTTVGTFSWTAPPATKNVTYLIVGGGGGGGGAHDNGGGAGGGAGVVLYGSIVVTPGMTYSVTVGAGGNGGIGIGTSGGVSGSSTNGSSGQNSSFGPLIASGGGGGKGRGIYLSGRSGYGGAAGSGTTPASGGEGGAGGSTGGGGGGAKTAGGNRTSSTVGGIGGAGIPINFENTGTVVYGTGGNASNLPGNQNGSATASNLGNGGTGASALSSNGVNGRQGGSGIVIIKFVVWGWT
jgi:hypothetical protein